MTDAISSAGFTEANEEDMDFLEMEENQFAEGVAPLKFGDFSSDISESWTESNKLYFNSLIDSTGDYYVSCTDQNRITLLETQFVYVFERGTEEIGDYFVNFAQNVCSFLSENELTPFVNGPEVRYSKRNEALIMAQCGSQFGESFNRDLSCKTRALLRDDRPIDMLNIGGLVKVSPTEILSHRVVQLLSSLISQDAITSSAVRSSAKEVFDAFTSLANSESAVYSLACRSSVAQGSPPASGFYLLASGRMLVLIQESLAFSTRVLPVESEDVSSQARQVIAACTSWDESALFTGDSKDELQLALSHAHEVHEGLLACQACPVPESDPSNPSLDIWVAAPAHRVLPSLCRASLNKEVFLGAQTRTHLHMLHDVSPGSGRVDANLPLRAAVGLTDEELSHLTALRMLLSMFPVPEPHTAMAAPIIGTSQAENLRVQRLAVRLAVKPVEEAIEVGELLRVLRGGQIGSANTQGQRRNDKGVSSSMTAGTSCGGTFVTEGDSVDKTGAIGVGTEGDVSLEDIFGPRETTPAEETNSDEVPLSLGLERLTYVLDTEAGKQEVGCLLELWARSEADGGSGAQVALWVSELQPADGSSAGFASDDARLDFLAVHVGFGRYLLTISSGSMRNL